MGGLLRVGGWVEAKEGGIGVDFRECVGKKEVPIT